MKFVEVLFFIDFDDSTWIGSRPYYIPKKKKKKRSTNIYSLNKGKYKQTTLKHEDPEKLLWASWWLKHDAISFSNSLLT